MKTPSQWKIFCVAFCLFAALMYEKAILPAYSAPTSDAPEWFFHDIVDAQFVAQHLQIPMSEEVMIIDSRPEKPKYFNGHIPMAINIPDTRFDELTGKLPVKKDTLLIFYCEGRDCKLSHKSAKKAQDLGYTNVKVYADGFPGWMKIEGHYASVPAEWIKKQLDDNADMLLVDSRPRKSAYDKGHIPTAISLPDSQFDEMKDLLPENRQKQLVFYCGGYKCKLSHDSAKKAIALGYVNVKVCSEGYPAWTALAVDEDGATGKNTAAEIKKGKEEGAIDIDYFKELVNSHPESVFIIDVRDADEFAKGSIKTSVNIPVDTLKDKIKTLPSDKPVVFVCGTGARSGESYYMVQDVRPELKQVYYLDAEMTVGKDGSFTIKKPEKK